MVHERICNPEMVPSGRPIMRFDCTCGHDHFDLSRLGHHIFWHRLIHEDTHRSARYFPARPQDVPGHQTGKGRDNDCPTDLDLQ